MKSGSGQFHHKTFFILLFSLFLGLQFNTALAQTPSLNVPITSTPPAQTAQETETPTPTVTAPSESSIVVVSSVGTQFPWNKRIPLKLKITPNVSGKRLEVRWQTKASITGKPEVATIFNPQAGKTYTFSLTLTPHAIGYQRAVADIILTTDRTNYVTSTNIPLQFDSKKVVVPVTSSYIFYQITMYITLIVFFFIVLPFVFYQIYLYSKNILIPRWLESRIKKPL